MAADEDRQAFAVLSDGGRLRYQPGLDGLRGLAVLAVLVFHTGRGWLPGGYLGVSLFFTVSGTVIGSVLLLEAGRTGAVSVRHFLKRRARRLYPAAWVVLGTVAVLRVATTWVPATTGADITTSFLQVFNWHLIRQGQSYADLFAAPSAVLHFWSLAIEEQLYLVVGVGVALIARRSARPAYFLGVVAMGGAVVSFLLPVVFRFGVDRTYYGTDTRAGEVFLGLALAAVIVEPTRRTWLRQRHRQISVTGVAAAATTLALWRTIPAGDQFIRSGLLPLTAAASALLIVAALVPPGPVWLVVQCRPLRWVGQISYGLYLIHFPVFVIVERLAPDAGPSGLIAEFAITFGLAILSKRFIEEPVHTETVPRRTILALASVIVLLGGIAVAAPGRRSDAAAFLDDLSRRNGVPVTTSLQAPTSSSSTTTLRPASATVTTPAPPTVVGWFGDSIAMTLLFATRIHQQDGPVQFGDIYAAFGCGVALSLPDVQKQCAPSLDTAISRVSASGATVAIVMSCEWELVHTTIPGHGTTIFRPGDPTYDQYVYTRYNTVIDRFRAAGLRRVLWVRCPHQSRKVGIDVVPPAYRTARDPAYVDHLNTIIDRIAAERPDTTTVDLATWMEPHIDDATIRPDGSHYEYQTDTGITTALDALVADALQRNKP